MAVLLSNTADQIVMLASNFQGLRISGNPRQLGVKLAIQGTAQFLASSFKLALDVAQMSNLLGRGDRGASTGQNAVHARADVIDMPDQFLVEDAHRRTTMRRNDNQTFALQLLQRFADGIGADPELGAQLLNFQPRTGRIDAMDDALANGIANPHIPGASN